MKRIALFAHFDGQNEVKPYIVEFLRRLRPCCDDVVFVSTATLGQAELDKVRPFCGRVLLRENVGFDFCMWQDALRDLDISDVDELVLTNSSVFGPIFPLAPIFERMTASAADFWGMTDNFAITWHLQSYFLVLKRRVLTSPLFAQFFASVLPFRDKWQVVRSYEVGLSKFLTENGFEGAAFAALGSWVDDPERRDRIARARLDSTIFFPLELLQSGMPFVKAALLRENPGRVPLEPVRELMRRSGYSTELVRFDRPGEPHAPRTLHRLRWRLRGF